MFFAATPLAHPFCQNVHLFNAGSDITISLQAEGSHIDWLAENRMLNPGVIMHRLDPAHNLLRIGLLSVQEVFIAKDKTSQASGTNEPKV
jgi:hypothetical protein